MLVKPTGPIPARIMIVGEAPGENEVLKGEPFVGASGNELTRMLQEAGIPRTACFITNVCRVRPPANDIGKFIALKVKDRTKEHILIMGKWCLPVIADGIEELKAEIEACQPTVIIALGNAALWALTGKWGIQKWRGSCLECCLACRDDLSPFKVIPSLHPAAILRQWNLRSVAVRDLRRAEQESHTQLYDKPEYQFLIRPSVEDASKCLDRLYGMVLRGPTKLAVDIETRAGHIACIGIAWSPTEALCIPLMTKDNPEGYWPIEQECFLLWRLYQLLTHANAQCVGQNFLYDSQYFYRHLCFIPKLVRDTMIAQHTCFSTLPKGLDFLSSMYCAHHVYWKDEGKDWKNPQNEDEYWAYNCKDCVVTWEVDTVLESTVHKLKLEGPAAFQQSLFWAVLETMNRGINVDKGFRHDIGQSMRAELASHQAWIESLLGFSINLESSPQVQSLFYKVLGQKPVLNRGTKAPSCDEKALQTIVSREPILRPLVDHIIEARSLATNISTFVEARLDTDGRLRCSFNIAGNPQGKSAPPTYRFSSSENAFGSGCNFQNIPPDLRRMFIPDEGYTFFDADLSSADLQVVVWESDEREMKALLAEGKSPYVEIAKEYYRDQSITKRLPDGTDHPKYKTFKSLAHGTHYLGHATGIAANLGLLVAEVERIQQWYFNRFPRIRQWQENFKARVFSHRMVENIFGYRLYIFDRVDDAALRQAIAWLPQSTIACVINRIYMNLHNSHPDIQVLLQVHDSLAGQFPSPSFDSSLAAIRSSSQIVLPYADPLIIPVGIKTSPKSWGDCK